MSTEINEKAILQRSINNAIAESLDNKAPYKIILGSLKRNRGRGKSLYSFVSHAVRARHIPSNGFYDSDFLIPSQPRNAFTENFDGRLNTGFFEEPYKSLHPKMITSPKHIGRPDPIGDLMEKTHKWVLKWDVFKKVYGITGETPRFKSKYQWINEDVLLCPKLYIDMAAHLEKKPDPYFDDCFNWYYSGKGNLSIYNFDGTDFIVRSEFNCLRVSPFFKENYTIFENNTASYECSEDTNILETVHSQNIIAIRTRCKIVILKLSIKLMTLEVLTEMESELPYTSISFDEYHKNILYATTIDYILSIVNIDRLTKRTVKLRGKFPTLEDNWSSVIGSERGSYLHVTRKTLTLYDKRSNTPYQRFKSIKHVADTQMCTRITAAKYCKDKPLLYLGATHELFQIDMRCSNTKEDNMKPVQRWTHGMISPPVYLDICNYRDNKEAVCLSSQWFEDLCVTTNYSDRLTRNGEIEGLCVPYRPPTILETLNEAQRQRLCCGTEIVKNRLCTFISGVQLVGQDDSYAVLMQNSLGDISCHNFYEGRMSSFIEDDAVEKLNEWSKDFEEVTQPIFEVTKVVDISPLLKNLRQVPDDYIIGRNAKISQRFKFNEQEIHDTYENEKLDPEFLEVWKDPEPEITLEGANVNPFLVDMS